MWEESEKGSQSVIGKKEEQERETNQEKQMQQDWDSWGEGKGRLRLDWTGRQESLRREAKVLGLLLSGCGI